MKILICDEDRIFLDVLKRKIIEYTSTFFEENTVIVDTFSDVFGLYDYIYDSKIIPDAVIMDIFFGSDKDCNGIEVAKRIKEEYRNINIIFCTANIENIIDAFDVEPVYILFKPLDDKILNKAIEKIYNNILNTKKRCVTIKAIKGIHRIMLIDIDYLESQGRYVKIHAKGEEIITINKIENIKDMLETDFLQCHKSYVVNYNKIKKYEATKLTLFDETEIPVSRFFRKYIKENLLNRI